jgi:hypothetical protein
MNTDNYDFDKSSVPQDLDGYTPFIDKQTNSYINDQNSGVYSATQSLVQFDLSSLYNSSRWTNTNDMFVTIPIIMAIATAALGAAPTVPPPNAAWALATLKSGYHHLISQADLQIDGKTVSETQPFLGTFTHVKLLSELSQNDLKSIGSVIGFSDVLDSPNSVIWNSSVTDVDLTNGNGLTNNSVFGTTTQTTASTNQNVGLCNEAINKRALKVADVSRAGQSKIVGAGNIYSELNDLNKLKSEYKSTYYVSGNYGYITDLAIIRLKDIFDCMNNIGLVKRFNGVLRLYINTGSLYVNCNVNNTSDTGTANPNYKFSVSNSTFTNVCPFTINNLNSLGSAAGIAFAQKQLAVGLFIGKTLPTNNNGINLGSTSVIHPQGSCRLYYSSIIMEPERALTYSRANQAKNVVFKNYYFNQISGVGANNNWSQLIQSGITNPYALIVIPYIGTTVTGMNSMSQYQSPFDTAPATGAPIILEELQVQLGGQQVLNSPYRYGFETFVSQFSNCEALSSSDFGVSCGVVNYEWWQANRIYYINLSRSTKADQITPRNIVLSFKNASSVPIDVQVFTVYLDRIVLNVDTGAVTR